MTEVSSELPENENPASDLAGFKTVQILYSPESDPMEKRETPLKKTAELNDEERDSIEENLEDEVSMEEEEEYDEEEFKRRHNEDDIVRSYDYGLMAAKHFADADADDDDDYYWNMKSKDTRCKYEKLSANNDDVPISGAQYEDITKNIVEVENVPKQEVLENILAVVQMKRRKLWSQMCSMEDELALHEYIVERLRGGDDVGPTHKCIQYLLSGNINFLMPKHEINIQDKGHDEDHSKSRCEQQIPFYGTLIHGKSSCADLEYQCLRNGWRLPRYIVEPSDGRFLSTVFVSSQYINLTFKGDWGLNPNEARESAAAKIIDEIQNAYAHRKCD